MPYLGKTPSQATRQRYYKTASGGETSLSGTMTVGGTLTFNDGEFVDVSVNGVALVAGTDYNTTTANTIGGLSALSANDQVEIVVYDTFSVFDGSFNGDISLGDNVKAKFGAGDDLQIYHSGTGSLIQDSGTGNLVIAADELILRNAGNNEAKADFTTDGAVNLYFDNAAKLATKSDGVDITGELQADSLDIDGNGTIDGSLTITTADNTSQLTLISTDADASVGPRFDLKRDSGSPADGDTLGRVRYMFDNDAAEQTEGVRLDAVIVDASDGTEDTKYQISTMVGGTLRNRIDVKEDSVVINQDSQDLDFRVESNGNTSMLVVDGGNNSVGIGLAAGSQEAGAFLHSGGQCLFQHNHTDTSSSGNVSYLAGNQALTLVNAQGGAVDQTCKLGFTVTTTGANSDALVECKSTAAGTTQLLFYVESSNTLGEACRIVNQNGGDLNFGGMSTFSFGNTETQVNKFQINSGRDSTSARTHAAFGNPNGQVGSITTNGSATAFNTSSDHRLKENVADMTGAITRVKTLAPKRFNFIADDSVTVDGFLAHEAQAVVPEAVTGTHNEVETWTQQEIDDGDAPDGTSAGDNKLDGDGNTIPVMQGIDQSKLVPLLTAALKEAITKIETLETQRADLEARVTALENAE